MSLVVQSLVKENAAEAVVRSLEALDNSAGSGKRDLMCERLSVVLGDASTEAVLDDHQLNSLRKEFLSIDEIQYVDLDEKTGTAEGHNRLANFSESDYLVTSDAEVIVDARALWRLASAFADGRVGVAEAKRLPVEHPKEYDRQTGRTSWAGMDFTMTRRDLFEQVGGFDEETFDTHGAAVDFSWLVREAGYDVVFHPGALVFLDRRLTSEGGSVPTDGAEFEAALSALLLAHKWSREDRVERGLAAYDSSSLAEHRRAAADFRDRRTGGRLVKQHDRDNAVGSFVDDVYAEHRFAL